MNTSAAQAAGESVEQKIARLERELAAALAVVTELEHDLAAAIASIYEEKGRAQREGERVIAAFKQRDKLKAQRDKAMREADAMEEFLGSAAKREKEASAIINAMTAEINIIVPIRNYTEMSPLDCYELGMMDGVAALKAQINAAIDAAMKECKK